MNLDTPVTDTLTSREQSPTPTPSTPPAVDNNGKMNHKRVSSAGSIPRIRLQNSESSDILTPKVDASFKYPSPEKEEDDGAAKAKPDQPEQRYGFPDQMILECLCAGTTLQAIQAREYLSQMVQKVEGSVGGPLEASPMQSGTLKRQAKSWSDLLSISTESSHTEAGASAKNTFAAQLMSSHEPHVILELYRQWISNNSFVPSSTPCLAVRPSPDSSHGEYCYPVTFVFKRDGEVIQLSDTERDALIGIQSITHSLSEQLCTDEEKIAENRGKMVGDLDRTDMVICIDLGKDCRSELYSTAVHRSYLDKKISEERDTTKKGELKDSRKEDIATAVDYWVEKLVPGFQQALPGLVRQDALNEPFMAMPNHFQVYPTKKGKGDAGHKLVLNVLDKDTVEVTASALYDQYQKPGAVTRRTHRAHILLKFSVRMERQGDLWAPVGCHCEFNLTKNKKLLEGHRKSTTASPQEDTTQALREFAQTSLALESPMKKLTASTHEVRKLSLQQDTDSSSDGSSTTPKVNRSLSVTTPYLLSPSPEVAHHRQFSEGDAHLGTFPSSLHSSATTSTTSMQSSSPESSLNVLPLESLHSRQQSQLSETDQEVALITTPKCMDPKMQCVTVGKQLYVTNMDHDKIGSQLRDNLVLEQFKQKLNYREQEWSREARPRQGRTSSSESGKLTNKLSMLANYSPSVSCFSEVEEQALGQASKQLNNPVKMDQICPEVKAKIAELKAQYAKKWHTELKKTLGKVKAYQVSVEVDRLPSISFRPGKAAEYMALERELVELREGYLQCINDLEKHLDAPASQTEAHRMLTLRQLTYLQQKSIEITKKYRGSKYVTEPALDAMAKDIELTSPYQTPDGRFVQTYMEVRKSELSMMKMLVSDMLCYQLYRMRPEEPELRAKYDLKDHLVRDMFHTGLSPENFDVMMKLVDTGVIEDGDDKLLTDKKGQFIGAHAFYLAKLEHMLDGHYLTLADLQTLENDTDIQLTDQLSATSVQYDAHANMSLIKSRCEDFLHPEVFNASKEEAVKLFSSLGRLLKKLPPEKETGDES